MKVGRRRSKPKQDLRTRAEELLRMTGQTVAEMSSEEVQRLVHELQVHQVELQMQNEELGRVQQELETARDRYADLYEFAPTAFLTLDRGGKILAANLAAASLLELDRRDLIQEKFTRFISPKAQDEFYLYRRRLAASNEKQTVELELISTKGARRVAHLEGVIIQDPETQKIRLQLNLTDLTDTTRAEEELRESERSLAEFFDQSPVGLLWVGADDRILRANRAALNLLDTPSADCLGHDVMEFMVDKDLCTKLLERLAAGESVQNQRVCFRSTDAAIKHGLVDANGLWELHRLVRTQWFVRDISKRVKLERELLEISEREQQRFAQDLHDDLGQVLSATIHLTSALQNDLAAKALPDQTQAGRILTILEEALARARNLARGLHPVQDEPNGLMVALKHLAAQTRSLFGCDCQFACPRPTLLRDNTAATHLYRIAQEAVTNSVKHGRAKRIRIGLTRTPKRISLAVRDGGVGLAAKRTESTGMGMRIMQYRAAVIDGSLVIQREPRGGTSVVCTIHRPGGEDSADKTR